MYKVLLPFLAFAVTLLWSVEAPAQTAEAPDAWSKPVNGLQARLFFAVKETINGTPIITTYLELRNVSDNANPLELPFDPPDLQLEFSATDAAGKAVSPAKGPFRELRADQGMMRIPFDGLLRVNIAHRGAAIPKDYAAHLDLGADAAIDGSDDAPAVWDFKNRDKQTYHLQAKLTVKKKNKTQWAGTIMIPKVKLPTSGSNKADGAQSREEELELAIKMKAAMLSHAANPLAAASHPGRCGVSACPERPGPSPARPASGNSGNSTDRWMIRALTVTSMSRSTLCQVLP
jgi:hypothetical protein